MSAEGRDSALSGHELGRHPPAGWLAAESILEWSGVRTRPNYAEPEGCIGSAPACRTSGKRSLLKMTHVNQVNPAFTRAMAHARQAAHGSGSGA